MIFSVLLHTAGTAHHDENRVTMTITPNFYRTDTAGFTGWRTAKGFIDETSHRPKCDMRIDPGDIKTQTPSVADHHHEPDQLQRIATQRKETGCCGDGPASKQR